MYARSAARPRPRARRARVERETFEPSVCGLSRVFVLPPARPLSCSLGLFGVLESGVGLHRSRRVLVVCLHQSLRPLVGVCRVYQLNVFG